MGGHADYTVQVLFVNADSSNKSSQIISLNLSITDSVASVKSKLSILDSLRYPFYAAYFIQLSSVRKQKISRILCDNDLVVIELQRAEAEWPGYILLCIEDIKQPSNQNLSLPSPLADRWEYHSRSAVEWINNAALSPLSVDIHMSKSALSFNDKLFYELSNSCVKQGHILKKSTVSKGQETWKEVYCLLTLDRLWFVNCTVRVSDQERQLSYVCLNNDRDALSSAKVLDTNSSCFIVTSRGNAVEDPVVFKCKDKNDCLDWINSINHKQTIKSESDSNKDIIQAELFMGSVQLTNSQKDFYYMSLQFLIDLTISKLVDSNNNIEAVKDAKLRELLSKFVESSSSEMDNSVENSNTNSSILLSILSEKFFVEHQHLYAKEESVLVNSLYKVLAPKETASSMLSLASFSNRQLLKQCWNSIRREEFCAEMSLNLSQSRKLRYSQNLDVFSLINPPAWIPIEVSAMINWIFQKHKSLVYEVTDNDEFIDKFLGNWESSFLFQLGLGRILLSSPVFCRYHKSQNKPTSGVADSDTLNRERSLSDEYSAQAAGVEWRRQFVVVSEWFGVAKLFVFDISSLVLQAIIHFDSVVQISFTKHDLRSFDVTDTTGSYWQFKPESSDDFEDRAIVRQWIDTLAQYAPNSCVTQKLIASGYLSKRGLINTAFKRRWFILVCDTKSNYWLRYYTEYPVCAFKGEMDLSFIDKVVNTSESNSSESISFFRQSKALTTIKSFQLLGQGQIRELMADTVDSCLQWIQVIRNAITLVTRSKDAHFAIDEDDDG